MHYIYKLSLSGSAYLSASFSRCENDTAALEAFLLSSPGRQVHNHWPMPFRHEKSSSANAKNLKLHMCQLSEICIKLAEANGQSFHQALLEASSHHYHQALLETSTHVSCEFWCLSMFFKNIKLCKDLVKEEVRHDE